ncbi:MAG: hypothetical protein CM1200mP22_29020 [Dehalococcoidia bacterium]|nr:MAG: hypothetical protein CM1200mP22_29020 [Dehalococcoidia bacterium]
MTTRSGRRNLEKVSTGSAEIDRRLGGGIPHELLCWWKVSRQRVKVLVTAVTLGCIEVWARCVYLYY